MMLAVSARSGCRSLSADGAGLFEARSVRITNLKPGAHGPRDRSFAGVITSQSVSSSMADAGGRTGEPIELSPSFHLISKR